MAARDSISRPIATVCGSFSIASGDVRLSTRVCQADMAGGGWRSCAGVAFERLLNRTTFVDTGLGQL